MMAMTYMLEDNEADKTVAYYSLLNDKIVFDPDEKKLWNRLRGCLKINVKQPLNRHVANSKRRKEYPAVKIGRLAISKDYAGQHIGSAILLQVKHVFATMRRSACRFITVDAYAAAVPFYEKCGFRFLSEKNKHSPTRAMYFDLINFPE